jgi:alanine-synthesizing transaminase
VGETRATYRRRADALVEALHGAGWPVPPPRATMFVWVPIPGEHLAMGSMAFARHLLREAGVVVSPGVGFGREGEGHVRFALIEPEEPLREAGARIARALRRKAA